MSRVRIITLLVMFLMECVLAFSISAEGRLYRSVPLANVIETSGFTVYDIKRTDDGFVWFATDRGLIRFDGEHGVRIRLDDGHGAAVSVSALTPAGGGSLIAATSQGVYRLQPAEGRYMATRLLDGSVLRATCGLRGDSGISLIGSEEGLVAFLPDGKTKRIKVGRDMLDLSNSIVDMAESEDGVYLLTKGGIWRFNPKDMSVVAVSDDERLSHIGVSAIGSSAGRLYIGTRGNGIWRLDLADGSLREVFSFTKGNVVTSLQTGCDGTCMYVGTDGGGVAKIALPSERIVEYARHSTSDPASPRSNQVYSLLADCGDRLWVGYYQNGADYTPSWTGPFQLIDDPAVFSTRDVPVRALSISDGRITIGTREGLTVFERNCSTAWSLRSPQLRSEMVISLLDHGGETYVGTYGGGVQILDPRTHRLRDMPYEGPDAVFRSGHIFAMASDRNGNLWLGTNEGLFMQGADGTRAHYTSANSRMPEGNVYGIFFDSEGKGWICTEKGLCVFDPRQKLIRTDLFPSGFPHTTRYRSVYEDSRHRLYFMPETGMPFSTNLDLSNMERVEHPLFADTDAKGLTEDSSGCLWMTTNRGIFRIDGNGLVVRFGLASGLPSPVFLQGCPVSDGEGHIWFGNAAGLLKLTESDIESSIRSMSPPVPTSLTVNGEAKDFYSDPSGAAESVILLSQSSPTVKIGFSTLTYALEEPDTYLFSIDGKEWQRLADDMSVTLYELSPGRHELRVKSANDEEGGDEITVVRLKVSYPIWWYVVGLTIVVLMGSIAGLWGLHRYRKNALRQQEALRRAEEEQSRQESESQQPAETPEEAPQKRKYASNTLSRNEGREIARKIEEVMQRDKPYLRKDLKVADLAEAIGVSSHCLSQFFSQHKQQTFYDYVNSFRVDEFKRIARKESSSLTLTAMAEQAGFSSRASFFRYFKNAEGISPGEWLKQIGAEARE